MPNGELTGAGGGWSGPGPERLPLAQPGRLQDVETQMVGGGDLRIAGWSAYGRVGPGVSTVVVQPEGLPMAIATLENGWFSAWWPVEVRDPNAIQGGEPDHFVPVVIRAYDELGNLLDESVERIAP